MPALDTSQIKTWRSIVTLIVFVLTNLVVLFPFSIPVYVPRKPLNAVLDTLIALRVISPRHKHSLHDCKADGKGKAGHVVRLEWKFPMNFVTAPLIADLFLLAILAIGRQEVHDGTIGAQNISPVDIMAFFLTLAYIAISIDASGLLRYLAFKVLQKGGQNGHRLYFYLYSFFFCLGSFIGNDPIILSGTAFLAYMTRVSADIEHPRAWIFAQFTVANIASAILVSSNPTNLVLAGAFKIKFIKYSANMIIPAVVTAVILFPCLLHIRFADPPSLIPESIGMRPLPDEVKLKKPRNPNIPLPRGSAEEEENLVNDDKGLEEILHPFLDGRSATFGAVIMAATLIAILVLNAVSQGTGEHPVFWVTLPAAFIMFCWDLMFGWCNRHETRKIARGGRGEVELPRAEWAIRKEGEEHEEDEQKGGEKIEEAKGKKEASKALESLVAEAYRWLQETFPTVMTVFAHLPYAVVPFALSMFVLVQALVTKGWVPVFAHGWDHWVNKTGTIGSIGGMGFLSVILCNFAGTNIGATILLSRVIQAWQEIHHNNGIPISNRTFWATVYSMALGVNYGAFSGAFSASLAGLLWRDILHKKHITVRPVDFARENLPIIAVAMAVGCTILVGEVYIFRNDSPYDS